MKWLRKLLAKVNPYWCKGCGKSLRRLEPGDLSREVIDKHRRAGTLGDLSSFTYICPDKCQGENKAVMIM